MNKKFTIFIISIFSFLLTLQALATNITEKNNAKSESSITAVTVYLDRAIITRNISKRLPKGENILVFDNLPETLDQNSIQADGEGNATIKDVKFRKEFFASVTDEDKRKLNETEIQLLDSIADANDIISIANKEQSVVQSLIDKLMARILVVSDNLKIPQPYVDTDEWIKIVTFYRTKLDALNKQIRLTERKVRSLNGQLTLVQTKRNSLGANQDQSKSFVEVLLEVKEESNVSVNLSYMVYGSTWYPVYDVRVFTDTKKMKITYQAMIQQNTTEDWDNVKIKLSTAKVNVGGQQPELNPWYLSLYDNSAGSSALAKRSEPKMAQMYNSVPAEREQSEKEELTVMPGLSISQASVELGATSAVFVLPGRNTIKSDNQQHKVSIMTKEFEASFRYSTVPKLAAYAYLKAKVKNTTDFPILAGNSNVFLDNNYISSARMNQVNPDQEFWTFLGIDEGIEIKYKVLKQYQKDEGIISKKNVYVFDYIIEITNNKKTEEEIVVWDQIPIANGEDIEVKLIEPDLEKEKAVVKIDDYKYLEWYQKLKPSEKRRIPFKFTIESPKNMSLNGM